MKKKIWIINHHATEEFLNHGGRHYYITKYLMEKGYDVTIFCANTVHNSDKLIDPQCHGYSEKTCDGIKFVFVQTKPYIGNGGKRILNMLEFFLRVKQAVKHFGKPDCIIGSSVHPLACVAAIQLSRRYRCKNIVEIRDLWPESIVAYGVAKKSNPLVQLLYRLEKWMYCKADAVVMTWPGGYRYIQEKGWDSVIPEEKVHHISNGVGLDNFKRLQELYPYQDEDLNQTDTFSAVYTGSIRLVNQVDTLLEAAKLLKERGNPHRIQILVWGNGDKAQEIQKEAQEHQLEHFKMKGVVTKNEIPSLLTQADCCILHNSSTVLDRFGQSQNKFFEYLAAGKPVLMTYSVGFSTIQKFQCGLELEQQTPEQIADALELLATMSSEERDEMGQNAMKAAEVFDFKTLTNQYIALIENI